MEYLQCLTECDVGLVSLDRRLKLHNFPGKLLGYVLCGKPVLASLNPGNELIEFLRNAGTGIAGINGEALSSLRLLLYWRLSLRRDSAWERTLTRLPNQRSQFE